VKDDSLYLLHIRECIQRIEACVSEGEEAFLADFRLHDTVMRNLQTLAESTQRLSVDLKTAHPTVDWSGISGFRNVLVHDYLGINLKRVWEIATLDVPELKTAIRGLLSDRE